MLLCLALGEGRAGTSGTVVITSCCYWSELFLVFLWVQVICVDGEQVFLGCCSPVPHPCSDAESLERAAVSSFGSVIYTPIFSRWV